MIRLILRASLLMLMLVIGLATLFSLYRILPLGQRCWLRKIWSRLLLSACGVALEIRPSTYRISKTPMLVVMNHVSWLDIFVLNSVMPATFIAKSEIRQWPLVGWLLQGADTLFIERSSRHAVRHVNHRIIERLNRGEHVAFFPESTTSDGRGVLPFHSSLFAMAVVRARQDDGPRVVQPPTVQPAALRYFQGNQPSLIPAYIGEQTFMESLLQILSARGLRARLQLLDPMLPPGPEITRQMLAQMAHTRIASAVGALDDSVFLASALEA